MENHAEIKDRCDALETRLDEIAADIRDLPFNYRIVDRYANIDEDVHEIYEWYETMKNMIQRYLGEKTAIERRLQELDMASKSLNNEVQNVKLQAFSRARHGGSYSQLPDTQRP
jgi:septation ring formation regulator EzrA